MPVAQVIKFDERQAIGRPRRKQESPCVIICLHRPPMRGAAAPTLKGAPDEDRWAGRVRDPG